MRIALVHDYLKEYGGAERVLRVLADMYPKAPIYTAFKVTNSVAAKEFSDREILESKWSWLIKRGNLYSPLRFLLPFIWGSIDLSGFDLVITSCSSYIARGFRVSSKTKIIAYCHTPPRFLYGYRTSVDWQKYWLVRLYAIVVNHFLRFFDFHSAQRVNYWLVNSQNVQERVEKFYRQDSQVIYPPVAVEEFIKGSEGVKKEDYFLIVSRLVGAKGLEEAAAVAKELNLKLKIAGGTAGYSKIEKKLVKIGGRNIQFLGRVSDKDLIALYTKAKGFIALARDEDFGMTVVEAQAAGTPVIAFNGGGFRESVVEGKTGILIDDTSVKTIKKAIDRFNKMKWDKKELQKQSKKFSRERFEKEVGRFINKLQITGGKL
ncbi:hypothetical protein COT63_01720 [Candidatus Shapirobacteria bacterium CG09_land_8_20_14_0_10_38_17]|uniref:Glycosyltransferase family 4 protein n=1 Tax=Candidatus Shapirobacteria bacterium CG09_land_8_20_14_0_10_38_17 TaxID=1974884 RepID=A0A2H0WR66_9BACT|nr:MAG: hypothetical protein COT63_01720 [Candidatus Shapirobacteria bacterium CG09_land_8_20_14_0_10_38_17]